MLDRLGVDSGHSRQQFAMLLPAERQVAAGLGRHGRQKDGLMEDSLQAGLWSCWGDRRLQMRLASLTSSLVTPLPCRLYVVPSLPRTDHLRQVNLSDATNQQAEDQDHRSYRFSITPKETCLTAHCGETGFFGL